MAALTQADLTAALAFFWHPVCTVAELAARPSGALAVELLGRELVVAPGVPISTRACQESFAVEVRHGLVWVCLDPRAGTVIPECPALEDGTMKVVAGEPYTWPTSAPRRVENFVDLAHFAWVHDGSLGRRDHPVPPLPVLRREDGELRFEFVPPPAAVPETDPTALVGASWYRMPMPCTVNIEFAVAGMPGVRRHLWMTASPRHPAECRTFWLVARNDRHDEPDESFLAFQRQILAEDEPIVCSQSPRQFPVGGSDEISVRSDRVSIEYRRWMAELAAAASRGPEHLHHVLETSRSVYLRPFRWGAEVTVPFA